MLPILLLFLQIPVGNSAKQGETLRLEESAQAAAVRDRDRSYPFFPSAGGGKTALIPFSALRKPGRVELVIVDGTDKELARRAVTIVDARFRKSNIVATKQMKALRASEEETTMMKAFSATVSPESLGGAPFALPVAGCLTSPFGVQRLHNGKPSGNYHAGLDIYGPSGTPVTAPADGVVRVARRFSMRGGTVGVDHGQGVLTTYFHLSSIDAKEGQRVRRGERLGGVGATGFANGPHLHWMVLVHGVPVNPLQWTSALAACR
jgi:murein DD-endopeptidase MepM/ murein hydrolase activator NlpD